jgi:hypothetical protein
MCSVENGKRLVEDSDYELKMTKAITNERIEGQRSTLKELGSWPEEPVADFDIDSTRPPEVIHMKRSSLSQRFHGRVPLTCTYFVSRLTESTMLTTRR